jgi:hypothetical protein
MRRYGAASSTGSTPASRVSGHADAGRMRDAHATGGARPLSQEIRRKHYLLRRCSGFRYEFKGATIKCGNSRSFENRIDAPGTATIKINI